MRLVKDKQASQATDIDKNIIIQDAITGHKI